MEPLGSVHVPDLGRVEAELREFWRATSEKDQATIRACTLNLVILCGAEDELVAATQAVARIAETHPGRALVIVPAAGSGDERRAVLGAHVSAHCHRGAHGAQVCSEQITLRIRPDAATLIPETVLQLLVQDVPVYVWWRRREPDDAALFQDLVALSDRLVVDTACSSRPARTLEVLADAVEGAERPGRIGDLTWARLETWRERIAGLFDPTPCRAYLSGIRSVGVEAAGPAGSDGITAAGALLAGWLASRLRWTPTRSSEIWRSSEGRDVHVRLAHWKDGPPGEVRSVRIESQVDSHPATFTAELLAAQPDRMRLRIDMDGACPIPYTQPIEARSEVELFLRELERRGSNGVFEESLSAAALFGG